MSHSYSILTFQAENSKPQRAQTGLQSAEVSLLASARKKGRRLISAQYGTEFDHAHYEKIKKVYSIWICMEPPKRRQNTITLYRFQEVNLVGNVKEPRDNYDLMNLVMVCLGSAEDCENQTLKMLDVLFSTLDQEKKRERLEKEFHLPMTQELEEEVNAMCNFSDVIEQRGIEKGLAQGRQEGRREAEHGAAGKLQEAANRLRDTAKKEQPARRPCTLVSLPSCYVLLFPGA